MPKRYKRLKEKKYWELLTNRSKKNTKRVENFMDSMKTDFLDNYERMKHKKTDEKYTLFQSLMTYIIKNKMG